MHSTRNKNTMVAHFPKRFGRAVRAVPVLTLAFAGCTCAGKTASGPPATATSRPAATNTAAPQQADTLRPTAGTPAPAQAAAPAALGAVTPSAACQAYVAVLSGRQQNPAALANPQLQAIATPDLVMCGAVFSDSDEMCRQLMPPEKGPSSACLQMRALFHELRAYPGKPSYLFDEYSWQQCREVPALRSFCDSLHEALRSGNLEDCDRVGDGASICRAYMKLDKSLCTVTGKLAELKFSLPNGKDRDIKAKEAAEESCREAIDSRAVLAKGLQALADSGPPREREFAKAALQQADACDTYVQAALQLCAGAPATPAAPDARTPAGAAGAPPEGGAPPEARAEG